MVWVKVLNTHGAASAHFALLSFSAQKLSCLHHKSALNNIRFYSGFFFPSLSSRAFAWITNEKESIMGAGSDSAPVVPAQGTEDIASELNGNGCW